MSERKPWEEIPKAWWMPKWLHLYLNANEIHQGDRAYICHLITETGKLRQEVMSLSEQLSAVKHEREEYRSLYQAGLETWQPVYDDQQREMNELKARLEAAQRKVVINA